MSVLTSINPANGDVVWQQPETSSDEFQDALTLARKTFEDWGFRSFDERASIVKAFSAGLEAEKENLAILISQEMGKPLWDSLGEVTAMINKAQISINAYHERTGQKESVNNGIRAVLEHRPHGVMAVFGPYNFPGHLPNGHIVPALLAGNVVLFKPSELTPAVADATLAIWRKAGLPEGVLQLINGGPDTGRALVQSPEIDGVLFTGSVPTGRAIARTLADRPHVSLALELGGNNPLIVTEVDDLDAASLITIQSAFISSGQRCTCARRLIVPLGDEGDRFIDQLAERMGGITIGAYDDDDEPFMGPLVSDGAAQAVLDHQADLLAGGGKAIVEARRLDRGAAFISPGLIDVTDVPDRPDAECFGPLLQVIRVADFDAAMEEANNTSFGLAAGLLSDNRDLRDAFYPRIRAGIVNWNQPLTGASSAAPFGGVGASGNNRPSAWYAADYCAWPVASLEAEEGKLKAAALPKGIKE